MTVDLSLYVLVDPAQAGGRSLAEIAAAAVRGGATLIQLRNKTGTTREFVEEARAIKAALAGTGVPLLVNDRVDVALAASAHGVHLGRDDLDPREARRLLGPKAIIGATVRSEADVATLAPGAIDYVCIGGVFATKSKDNPDPPVGLGGFSRLAGLVRGRAGGLPVGAIAGIDENNAADVIRAGADGIAVVSAVIAARNPEAEARKLRGTVDAAKAQRGAAA
ncbi:MAG: thiamine phosphate synthase [Bradyrhizobiaceae bacterium]|nr:thiamine phosphate synthase [Bradyrhizobiaceae bacterium]